MKRSSACSLQADEPRLPRQDCSFPQVVKFRMRASHEKTEWEFRCNAHPNPLPQERERPSSAPGRGDAGRANPVAGIPRVLRTILPLLEERAGVRTSHKKNGWHAPARHSRKSLIFTIFSDISYILSFCSSHQRAASFQRIRVDLRPFAAALQFLKFQKQLMQVVDFHDSFRYFLCPSSKT
jgi:hypothetical protein